MDESSHTPPSGGVRPSSVPIAIIGSYRLLRKIGEGGMGEVYLAEQQRPLRRRVALKIIRQGLDDNQVIARFEAERQALALMDHPAIAKVFDAGTTATGRPFFAMEYVPGEPVTQYCDTHKLTTRDRLALFIQICEGIHHAHQKAVIHRDLKPSNILVAQNDKPIPKIIDFGVAKATTQHLTEMSLYTEFGQLIGTPEYMSPEQAEMAVENVDTRTDVYSLGVVLYEMLTGTLPFDWKELREAGFEAIQRAIRETDPPRPSARLRTARAGPETAASNRGTSPQRLMSRLRGDLDWIVLKALEKDRSRRYGTASELAADLRRHLNNEPVLAGPPSVRYTVGKFVRRNRVLVGGALATLATLVVGAGVATFQAIEQGKKSDQLQRFAYVFAIRAAAEALAGQDRALAREQLQAPEIPPELRQWEWRHLWSRAQPEGVRVDFPRGSADRVHGVRFEGSDLVGAVGPERFRVDAASGTIRERWSTADATGGSPSEAAVVVEHRMDGGYIVQEFSRPGGSDIHLLGNNGEECTQTRGNGVTLGPQGSSLVAIQWQQSATAWAPVQIWDLQSCSLRFSAGDLFLGFSPDGSRSAVIDLSLPGGAVLFHDTRTGELLARLQVANEPSCCAFSTDGKYLALGGFDGGLRVLAIEAQARVASIQAHGSVVAATAFSHDGRWLASASADRWVRLWELGSSRQLAEFRLDVPTRLLSFSADGLRLCAGGDQSLTILNTSTSTDPWALRGHENYVYAVAFHPDGQMFATADYGGTILFWDARTYVRVAKLQGPHTFTHVLRFSADGSRLVALSGLVADSPRDSVHCVIDLWDVHTGLLVRSLEQTLAAISPATGQPVDPGGNLIIASLEHEGDEVILWDATRGTTRRERVSRLESNDGRWLSAEGRFVLVNQGEGDGIGGTALEVVDRARGSRRKLPTHLKYWTFGFNHAPGEKALVVAPVAREASPTAEVRSTLGVWEAESGAYRGSLTGHSGEVLSVRFSPDDRRIATGSRDGTIKLWDSTTLQEVVQLKGHAFYIKDLAFSPDGSQLISVSGDKTVRVWDTVSFQHVVAARRQQQAERLEAESIVAALDIETIGIGQAIALIEGNRKLEDGVRREALRELRRISIRINTPEGEEWIDEAF